MISSKRTYRLSTGVRSVLMGSSYCSVEADSGALRFLRFDEEAIVHTGLLDKMKRVFEDET